MPDSKTIKDNRTKGGWLVGLRGSHMAQRIITFNFVALCILLLGILFLIQTQSNAIFERQKAIIAESELIANFFNHIGTDNRDTQIDLQVLLDTTIVSKDLELRVFNSEGEILAQRIEPDPPLPPEFFSQVGSFSEFIDLVRIKFGEFVKKPKDLSIPADAAAVTRELASSVTSSGPEIRQAISRNGFAILAVGRPIDIIFSETLILVTSTREGLLDQIVRRDREIILRVFALAALVSLLLSLVLARTIASPIHELAVAAEARKGQKFTSIDGAILPLPSMVNRPDEIGRLASAMQDMTNALYRRIDSNQRFAADVAHELKNPLASLRSATETLRIANKPESRARLLGVIEHDVNRMDRLISDISNASRLDSELVKEETERFELNNMLREIINFHQQEATKRGINLTLELPNTTIFSNGLEPRLAQVFVNLLTNAISFCDWGDKVRMWVRVRDDRILIAVEDTGPGIPEDSIETIFERFYSSRPDQTFGNHSGLGLSISKQIIEAHGGVIWAENIYRNDGASSKPLGARFVVGLPF
jgi:two-component system sensor histidine kinase ChvG